MSEKTSISKKIDNKINIEAKNTASERVVMVLVGLDHERLSYLETPHLFSDDGHPVDFELLFEPSIRRTMVERLLSVESKIVWCTYEEYQVIGDGTFDVFGKKQFLINNAYPNLYPIPHAFSESFDRIIDYYEETEPDIGDSLDSPDGIEMCEHFYIGLTRVNGDVFGSYKILPGNSLDLYASIPQEIEKKGDIQGLKLPYEIEPTQYSITEFADKLLREHEDREEVPVVYSPELFKSELFNAIQALCDAVEGRYRIIAVSKPTEPQSKEIDQYGVYKLLGNYWGYEEFKNFLVYKNARGYSSDKSTTPISQKVVIDTILDQAIHAQKEEPWRDVFVTAPTGTGKSLMFQIPALYLADNFNLVTIVVSPLIGLMKDQVNSLAERSVEQSATINSEVSPVEKREISKKIRAGEKSILYLSPETLLSRSDISMLIGERKLGLVVIDEAHIVTTWGKAFRADYWYLGTYLHRLRKQHQFPIATFTATAIYGGIEDMYVETRDSLHLISPITFLGYVKRGNIALRIQSKLDYSGNLGGDYRLEKFSILLQRLSTFYVAGLKTLVYFPTVRLLTDFHFFIETNGSKDLFLTTGLYYGPLNKTEKQDSFEQFRSGSIRIMLATKAFGMGIDIPDIGVVYHFAPTGNICDYVQEIGRAARALPVGYACFDYLSPDFSHVNRLHGISSLRHYQLVHTIRKVLDIVHASIPKRNLLVNADEFRHIFSGSGRVDDERLDNQVKTAMLIIEKDLEAKYGYSPLIARPRALFTHEFFSVVKNFDFGKLGKWRDHFYDIGSTIEFDRRVLKVNLKAIWKASYQHRSFAQFKYFFHSQPDELDMPFRRDLVPLLILTVQFHSTSKNVKRQVRTIAQGLNNAFTYLVRPRRFFSVEEFAEILRSELPLKIKHWHALAESILRSAYEFCGIMRQKNNHYRWWLRYIEKHNKYELSTTAYEDLTGELNHILHRLEHSRVDSNISQVYIEKAQETEILMWYTLLGMLEDFGVLHYRTEGGNNPEIFIRINSVLPLQNIVDRPDRYKNRILENVSLRHRASVSMLSYLFTEKHNTDDFWESVEDYFLGQIPEKVMEEVYS